MKRRAFLLGAALAASSSAWAAKKKGRPPAKAGKHSGKRVGQESIDFSDLSANRLPPVRAAELPEKWRRFTLSLAIDFPGRAASVTFPLPLAASPAPLLWQRVRAIDFSGAASFAWTRESEGARDALALVWPNGVTSAAHLEYLVETAPRFLDVSRRTFAPERADLLRQYADNSALRDVQELARTKAREIVGRIVDPVARARALFDWVAVNSQYQPELENGGVRDVAPSVARQLQTGRCSGGSAEICGLFVALARALELPARLIPGLRLIPSYMEVASDASLSARKHPCEFFCRAEFYAPGYNWVAVDAAGVCRALRRLAPDTQEADALRRLSFGFWEMNWAAFALAEAFTLPSTLPFWSETAEALPAERYRILGAENPAR
ncbi:MAG: transglutaminase-like domain-containing protein [Zoogloeaceae bacterium]|jgi:transglutaminase-like putative cysteine protease|nr:transglutaminase-like domain-containing protein [Zoogloeaceae bacterium]